MNRRFILSFLPFLLLVAVLAGISSPGVHAPGYPNGPGEVCLNDASAVPAPPASPCPAAPHVFGGPFPSTPQAGPAQARVGVYVNGSAGTNAFDITLLTTPTVLKPADIDLTGSVLNTQTGPATVVLECVGTALIHGSVCSANDTAGTIHLAVAAAPGAFVNPPLSGLLFTAIFNITGTAPAGGVVVGFQTQCGSATSVVGGACVTIASGGKTPDAETIQTAVFDNSGGNAVLSWFAVQSNVTSASLLQGATTGNHVLITVTAPNGLPVLGSASISLTFTVSPAANALSQPFSPPVFTATSSPTAACSVFAGTPLICTQPATIVTSVAGNYLVTMIGTYTGDNCAGAGSCSTTYSLLAPLAFTVTVTGAGWVRNGQIQSATSTDTNYYAKGTQSIVQTFASLGGYTGIVTVTQSVCSAGTTGAVCPFGLPPAFNLGVGQIVTKLINFTTNAPGRILYRNTMAATGLPTLTDGTDTIFIAGFGMVSNVTSLTFASGGHAGALVTVTSQGVFVGTTDGRFVGPVAINSTTSPSGLKITCTPNSLTLLAGASQTSSCSFTANVTSTTTFTTTITGVGGVNNAMTNSTGTISVMVTAVGPPPGINLSASPTSVTTNVGSPGGTSTVTVASRGGFTGTAALTASPSTGCTLSPTSVILPAGGTSALRCTSAVAQNIVETVTATSGTTTNSTNVTFIFQDFSMAASPTSVTVNAGSAGTSSITVTAQNGFAGVVNLASNSTACTVSPTSVTGSGSATLSCTFASASTVHVGVTGTSGSLSHSVTVTYVVQDFTIAASPTSVNVNVNAAGTSSITISPVNGFAGVVSLVTNTTASCTVSPTSVTGSGSSTLSCTFTSTGNKHVSVTGTSGSLSHSVTVTFVVQDFTITASPTSVTVNAKAAGTSTITVTAVNGFAGVVSLTTNSTSCTVSPTSVTGSGIATLSCTFASASTVHVGVTGASGSLSHSVTVTYTAAPDFTIAASPTSVNVNVNAAGTSTIAITAQNGFTGVVNLATNTTASCTVSPATVTGSGSSTLSCTFTTTGNKHVSVTGTSGSLSHSVTVTFTVQDFTITVSPTSVTVNANSAGTSTITVAAVNGFSGVVSLTTNSTSCTLSPTSVPGSGSATLSCTFTSASTVHEGVTGTSGSLSHSVTVTYIVQDFTITASPTNVAFSAGTAASSTITLTGLNGFAGVVSLVTNSTSCTVSPTSVTGSGTSTLSCAFATGGTFHVGVTGTSGSLSHSVTVTFTAAVDFTITASPTTVTVNVGSPGTSTITITPLNGFTGTVSLASNSTACTLTLTSVITSGSSTLSCTFASTFAIHVTVTGTSGSISHSATVTFIVQDFTITASPSTVSATQNIAATSTITVAVQNGFAGMVNLASNSTSCTLSPTSVTGSGSSTLSCTFTATGTFHVGVTGTNGALSHSVTVTFNVSSLSLTCSPTSFTLLVGASGTSNCTVSGASGAVSITITTSSTAIVCSATPSSLTGSGTFSVTCTSNTAGVYTVIVAVNSGSQTASVNLSYTVQDFTITASPTTVGFTPGSPAMSTITVTGLNGFVGVVSLTTNSTSCSLSPTSVTGSGSSTLSCTFATSGTFHVGVVGTSGSLSHSATVTFNVTAQPDFTISASPSSVNFTVGSSAAVTITVASVNGFTGTVTLTSSVSPSGLTATCSPATISLGTSGISTCTLSSSTAGSYTVTVTGTSGTLSHSAIISATVTQVTTAHPTQTNVNCSPGSVVVNAPTNCTARVIDTSSSPTTPTGTVTFTTNSTGDFSQSATCALSAGSGPSMATCKVSYTPTVAGHQLITGTYGSDSGHASSSGNFTLNVRTPRGQAVMLSFSGFALDDFDNGVGQFQVLVNGQLVVDIPAGLNHLTGTGDYKPYENTAVDFGPFDISNILVSGQNTILFKDPTPFDHFGVVRNVLIVQGDTILLQASHARGVYPGFSFSYTFSNPPLTINSFTSSPAAISNQLLTFAVTYTGGTGSITCFFRFGDDESAAVRGNAGTCSITHDYDSHGTFPVVVTVRGASTSDLQTVQFTITV